MPVGQVTLPSTPPPVTPPDTPKDDAGAAPSLTAEHSSRCATASTAPTLLDADRAPAEPSPFAAGGC
jgi:hypothetical protein